MMSQIHCAVIVKDHVRLKKLTDPSQDYCGLHSLNPAAVVIDYKIIFEKN